MKLISTVFLLIILPFLVQAQTHCTALNKEKCKAHLTRLSEIESGTSIQEVAILVGKGFMGTPYVGKTLEIEGEEQLVIELQGLDCTTFLENVVVLARLVQKERLDFESFQQELTHLRYRDGELNGYPSRLHYFSDWIANNSQKGIIQDITSLIGGKSYEKQIDFMSTHTSSYRQLANAEYVKSIKQAEDRINNRKYHFIPKAEVAKVETEIQSGDLIAITTGIKGLDIVHVGLAIREKEGGRIHLFHASTGSKEVEISTKPLADYLMGNKSQSGIMVCRLQEPG